MMVVGQAGGVVDVPQRIYGVIKFVKMLLQ